MKPRSLRRMCVVSAVLAALPLAGCRSAEEAAEGLLEEQAAQEALLDAQVGGGSSGYPRGSRPPVGHAGGGERRGFHPGRLAAGDGRRTSHRGHPAAGGDPAVAGSPRPRPTTDEPPAGPTRPGVSKLTASSRPRPSPSAAAATASPNRPVQRSPHTPADANALRIPASPAGNASSSHDPVQLGRIATANSQAGVTVRPILLPRPLRTAATRPARPEPIGLGTAPELKRAAGAATPVTVGDRALATLSNLTLPPPSDRITALEGVRSSNQQEFIVRFEGRAPRILTRLEAIAALGASPDARVIWLPLSPGDADALAGWLDDGRRLQAPQEWMATLQRSPAALARRHDQRQAELIRLRGERQKLRDRMYRLLLGEKAP